MSITQLNSMGTPTTPNTAGIQENIRAINADGVSSNDLENFLYRYKITEINSNYTIKKTDKLILISSGSAITVTLPNTSTLVEGDNFTIIDFSGNSSSYNISFDLNGATVNGLSSISAISSNRKAIEFIYTGGTAFIAYEKTPIS